MIEIFVDASFWIALRANNQADHKRAVEIALELAARKERLVTTQLVFAEIHAFFSRTVKLKRQIIADFSLSVHQIEPPKSTDHEEAIELLEEFRDKSFSYCDAVSFVVMRRLRLKRALSFDDHFRQIGEFEILS